MREVWRYVVHVWQQHVSFKCAALYLIILVIAVLLLPILPLPYPPNYMDYSHLYLPPLSGRALQSGHVLGTDGFGRDLLVNMLYGGRSALLISFSVMACTSLLGLLLGMTGGFFGDRSLRLQRAYSWCAIVIMLLFCYFGLYLPVQLQQAKVPAVYFAYTLAGLFFWSATVLSLAKLLLRFDYFSSRVSLPLDSFLFRVTETVSTIPRFILVLALAALIPPSVPLLALLLILTSWTGTARLARAEMLRIRALPFFESAVALGSTPKRLLLYHSLPNLLGPVLVHFTFGLGGLLMLESTLTFLNIGLPTDFVSWGRMIAGIRSNTSAWWLVALPGGFLSLTVLALYTCSYYLSKALQKI